MMVGRKIIGTVTGARRFNAIMSRVATVLTHSNSVSTQQCSHRKSRNGGGCRASVG
jgi:hypothetical protein